MSKKYILAIDQGTTSSRAILFDKEGKVVSVAQHEFTQIFPREGWVEHDPIELLFSQTISIAECCRAVGATAADIAAAGITVILSNLFFADQGISFSAVNWKGWILAALLWFLTNKCKKTKGLHPIVFIGFSAVVGILFSMG